jgi:hypothetical protein
MRDKRQTSELEGWLCDSCSKGQFFVRGYCDLKCTDIEPQGVVTVFGIIGVIILWVILNKSAGGLYECLDVGLGYAQVGPHRSHPHRDRPRPVPSAP